MIYILAALAIAFALTWWIAPKSHVVFAGLADGSDQTPPGTGRWPGAGRAVDFEGEPIDVRGKFIGLVRGASMCSDIPDGSRFIADYVSGIHDITLRPGDIVVAKEFDAAVGPQRYCYCLRKIKSMKNGQVEYEETIHGIHAPHDFERVIARVSHVFGRSATAALASALH